MSLLYNTALVLAALLAVPYYGIRMLWTGKYRASFGPKFGKVPPEVRRLLAGSPRIWIHAVSVGEVTAAAPIVSAVRGDFPGACIVLSTGTETGQAMARQVVEGATAFLYFPLDIPRVVRRVLDAVRPDLFVTVETEIWPNFLRLCQERGCRLLMVNGRISPRSFRNYRWTRFFWKGVLNRIGRIGVISETDALRLRRLGTDPARIRVLGNAKYDGLASRVDERLREEAAFTLGIAAGERVFVAGSTHEGEERQVLAAYRDLLATCPDCVLVIVPRHPERGDAVTALVREAGFADTISMGEILRGRRRRGERVIVVDVIGELFKIYGLATIVFCGGSLVPRGGQNLLEAAAWGKVVFHGPHMEDFRNERALLADAGAGICVTDGMDLFRRVRGALDRPGFLAEAGERGRRIVVANQGASRRYADMIRAALDERQASARRT